jgi:RNA polymerase sigma-70 factor, ECF subfamily
VGGESALKRRGTDSRGGRPKNEERHLIEAAQRDPRYFAELYEINFERVYAFIARRIGDRDQAQDLTADVFHKALKNLSRFEWRGVPFAAWLFRIAANAIANRGKRTARFEAMKLDDFAEQEHSDPADLEEIEHRARLFKMVDKLPADQRRVIAMRFAQQKNIAEIPKELGRSEGAVKQLQFRGLQNLRTLVGER